MFFVVLFFILAGGFSFLFDYFIPLSHWFLFLWIPMSIILAVVIILGGIILFVYLCPKNNPKGKVRHFIMRNALWLTLKFEHVHTEVVGLENIDPNETYVIYGNHKSMLDPVIMYVNMHVTLTAIGKSEIFENGLVNTIAKAFGAISLNRNNTREAVKSINQGIETLKGGLSVIIFPEGGILTREDEHMTGLRAGAYKLVLKSERPILPITLIGTSKIASTPRIKRKNVKLIIHKPIMYEEVKDLNTNQIGEMVEELINGDINENKN